MNARMLTVLVLILIAGVCSAEVMVENLRCEYLENPLGIDVVKPRLTWIVQSKQRDWMQGAYQILVASSEEKLKDNEGDLWDSGKVESDQSIHIVYGGKPLTSRMQCYWKVRVWDKYGKTSAWSKPALWSMGLLEESDWQGAQWIGLEQAKKAKKPIDEFFLLELAGSKTHRLDRIVIHNYGQAESGYNHYSKDFSVEVSTTSKDKQAFKRVLEGTLKPETGAQTFPMQPVNARYVKLRIHSGYQEEFIELGEFEVYSDQGANVTATDNGAKLLEYSSEYPTHLAQGVWPAANIIDGAKSGHTGSWCSKGYGESEGRHSRLPARYVRREFEVNKPVKCATAYVCGLGEFDLFLNGREATDRERDPGIMMYNKRLLYVTFDVTDYLKHGANGVGVILGNGRYFSPRGKGGHALHFGNPKLLLLLRVEHLDGTIKNLISDSSWTITDNGPIRANNEFDGEEYDARMEMPDWSKARFDDSGWQPVQLVKAPGGRLEAFMYEPMRVTETLKPVAITNPDPGVYIVDMGQGFYGTVRLRVSGPAGTRVQMRSSFSLFENGRFNVLNNRSAQTTDVYILKGRGQEVWYPRFRGQGYRYVEVTGFPGFPRKNNFEGLFVHCDVEETGGFECSNPLVNKFNKMMRYDQMGQKRGATMDPDRDERQGWLGGSCTYFEDESAHMNVAAHYTKWLEDIRLDQRADGAVSDVSPALWQTYTGDLVWPADLVLVPLVMHKYYGDLRVLAENYEAMKKWFQYAQGILKDDFTVDHNRYGDWCDVYSMGGKGPMTGKTSKPLISTAWYSFLHARMAQIATLLGKDEDAKHFAGVAEKVKQAFNKRFFDPATNTYESKTQCSYVLPLAFGLVPEDRREAVIDNLVHDIMVTHNRHVSTGLVGMLYYMRTLMNVNRGDVAYALVNQATRPSWGYMVSKGASGMWERWDQDTQGAGMNGQGFLMLTGDLNAWIYQALAGIRPDPQRPGFKHIILRPQPAGDLTYVNASYKSMHGWIVSNWKLDGNTFKWHVTVPANTTATVYVPAKDADCVTESGKPADEAKGVKFLRMDKDAAVFKVGSGNYAFASWAKRDSDQALSSAAKRDGDSDYTVAAYYYPDYHVDPTNEAKLGPGWTEWELVKNAKPNFEGHQQPKVPLWGYQDESKPAVMAQKIAAAADHGIDVFLFDWYWYDDGPYLERALEQGFLKAKNNSRLKFAVVWCNHDWSVVHIWGHKSGKVTPATFDTMTDHIVETYFRHPSYWTVDGRPFFSVYELHTLIEGLGGLEPTAAALRHFREKTKAAGFPDLHLNAVTRGIGTPPGQTVVKSPAELASYIDLDSVTSYQWVHHVGVRPYKQWMDGYLQSCDRTVKQFDVPYYPNVTMGWDPTARYPGAATVGGNTPDAFEAALIRIKDFLAQRPPEARILTINAWNEWPEGSYLEPDTVHGMAYLEAIKDVFFDNGGF